MTTSANTKTLDVHIKRLRAKVETEPANPPRLLTIRGVGYQYASGSSAPQSDMLPAS